MVGILTFADEVAPVKQPLHRFGRHLLLVAVDSKLEVTMRNKVWDDKIRHGCNLARWIRYWKTEGVWMGYICMQGRDGRKDNVKSLRVKFGSTK